MREDPTLTLAAFGAFAALGLAFLLALLWGYSTVALVWLREALAKREGRAEDKRLRIASAGIKADLHRAAALSPRCGGGQR